MRVLLAAPRAAGGIQTYLRYVYSRDFFSDCRFTLLTQDAGASDYLRQALPDGRITVAGTPENDSRRFVARTRELLRSERYDLLHSHGFTAGALAAAGAFGVRVPHLMTGHDMFLPPLFRGSRGRLRHLALGAAYARLTAVHTATEDGRANFRQFFPHVPDKRLHAILHGIDTEWIAGGGVRDLKGELGLSPETPLIGFFGRFMSPKGFRDLIGAMQVLVEGRLLEPLPRVVTFGWNGFIREDYAHLGRLGLADHFSQLPQTDRMPASLRGVDVVAMPSRWEACGLLAMETLCAGVPLVGTTCIGLREVLAGTPALTAAPADPAGLARALAAAVAPDVRPRFASYRAQACERFSSERTARELRDLYGRLAGGRGC